MRIQQLLAYLRSKHYGWLWTWRSALFLCLLSFLLFGGFNNVASALYSNLGSIVISKLLPSTQGSLSDSNAAVAKARVYLWSALSWNPQAPNVYRKLGSLSMLQGDFQTAVKWFRKYQELCPRSRLAYLDMGDAYDAMGRTDEAMALWRLTQAGPLFLGRAKSYIHRGDLGRATIALQLATESIGDSGRLWSALGQTYDELARRYELLGRTQESSGAFELAIEAYSKAVSVEPNEANYRISLGKAYRERGMVVEAIEQFTEVTLVTRLSSRAWAYAELGLTYLMSEDYVQAAEAYEEAVRFAPDNAGHRIMLASVYKRLGLFEEALGQLMVATTTEDARWRAWAYGEMGIVYQEQEGWEDAIRVYGLALEADPTRADYRILLGQVYEDVGMKGEAIAEFEAAAKTDHQEWREWAERELEKLFR